jgi:hypothetical protein
MFASVGSGHKPHAAAMQSRLSCRHKCQRTCFKGFRCISHGGVGARLRRREQAARPANEPGRDPQYTWACHTRAAGALRRANCLSLKCRPCAAAIRRGEKTMRTRRPIAEMSNQSRKTSLKNSSLANAARVDIAGVASSILATPTISPPGSRFRRARVRGRCLGRRRCTSLRARGCRRYGAALRWQ